MVGDSLERGMGNRKQKRHIHPFNVQHTHTELLMCPVLHRTLGQRMNIEQTVRALSSLSFPSEKRQTNST